VERLIRVLKGGLEFKRRVEGSEVEKRVTDINVDALLIEEG
jgi:hypothetical protein